MMTFSVFSKEKIFQDIQQRKTKIAKFTGFAKNKVLVFFKFYVFVYLFVSVKHAGKKIRISCETNLGFVLSWSFVDTKWP